MDLPASLLQIYSKIFPNLSKRYHSRMLSEHRCEVSRNQKREKEKRIKTNKPSPTIITSIMLFQTEFPKPSTQLLAYLSKFVFIRTFIYPP